MEGFLFVFVFHIIWKRCKMRATFWKAKIIISVMLSNLYQTTRLIFNFQNLLWNCSSCFWCLQFCKPLENQILYLCLKLFIKCLLFYFFILIILNCKLNICCIKSRLEVNYFPGMTPEPPPMMVRPRTLRLRCCVQP